MEERQALGLLGGRTQTGSSQEGEGQEVQKEERTIDDGQKFRSAPPAEQGEGSSNLVFGLEVQVSWPSPPPCMQADPTPNICLDIE